MSSSCDTFAITPVLAHTTPVVEPVLEDSDGGDDDIVDLGIEVDDVAVHHFQVTAATKPAGTGYSHVMRESPSTDCSARRGVAE